MSLNDALWAISEGNPGAINVLVDIINNPEIDPDNAYGPWGLMVNLDHLEVYGPRIWILYKDICGESLPKTVAITRACQLGIISREQLDLAINKKQALDVEKTVRKVKNELPNFKA